MRLAFAVLPLALLTACSKLTPDNYDKLKTGMSYAEVKAVLGAPDRCSEMLGVKSCVWGDDKRYIAVNFLADQVVLTSAENLR